MEDLSYEANTELVKAGFASIIHLAVLEGLKKQEWSYMGRGTEKLYYTPQISFAFEGGWDLAYPHTCEMRTYGGYSGSLRLDVKYGENNYLTDVERRFCREVVRLWKLCEQTLLTNDTPKIPEAEINEVIAELKKKTGFKGLKHALDGWTEEQYKTGAEIVIALAKAVGVVPSKLAQTTTRAFGNPFHKYPYVEVAKR